MPKDPALNAQDSALKPPYPPIQAFPAEWKSVCLEILTLRRAEIQKTVPSRDIGWGTIRDIIMEAFDTYDGSELKKRDRNLSGQNLQDWYDGSTPTDAKFRFVNLYIVQMEKDGHLAKFRSKISEAREDFVHKALLMIYSKYKFEGLDSIYLDDFYRILPDTFVSKGMIKGSLLGSSSVHFVRDNWGVRKILFAYHRFNTHFSRSEISSSSIYEGFLIPQSIDTWTQEEDSCYHARFNVKLFRPAYRGDPVNGFADGVAEIEVDTVDGKHEARFLLKVPPLAVDPFLFKHSTKNSTRHRTANNKSTDIAVVQRIDDKSNVLTPKGGIIMEMEGYYFSDTEEANRIINSVKGYFL
ncbi:hypothetical protein [Sphingobium sp. HWE2-09]|uniref:hypothetical protein n=1 Tax=Sphingobium sp. HWE2-09 TaxID=3108390 RepID=UPI002DC21AC4|nr:hypothetical protein [Sphingobium sp. HWE2-09]